jgi:hypothetical protein
LFYSQFEYNSFVKKNEKFIAVHSENVTNINWCDFLKGRNGNRLNVYIIKLVFPQLFQKCPFLGRFELVNANIGKVFFNPGDPGLFRVDLKLTDEESKDFIFMSGLVEIKDI